jgi:hypothetical protein
VQQLVLSLDFFLSDLHKSMSDLGFLTTFAQWYDEFRKALPRPDSDIRDWERNSTATIKTYKEKL